MKKASSQKALYTRRAFFNLKIKDMKLYEVPNNTQIRVLDDIAVPIAAPQIKKGDVLTFSHIDGMYSYCKNPTTKEIVHLVAWAEVEIVDIS